MLLAAGAGKRMLPLTRKTPKPLLKVGELTLIEHHIVRLKQQGFRHIVVNLAHLGEQIRQQLSDGSRYGLRIEYSDESATGALETAGGIRHALPLIKSDPFIAINADIWTDYDFAKLAYPLKQSARIVMVPNPPHNQHGDYSVIDSTPLLQIVPGFNQSHTYSGIALYRKALFEHQPAGSAALAPLFRKLIGKQALEGEVFNGAWQDIGTPERLTAINQAYLETSKGHLY